jgi:hypothetical protein
MAERGGRIDGEGLPEPRRLVEAEDHHLVLDLKDLKVVDRNTVRFLAGCEAGVPSPRIARNISASGL